MKFAAVFMMMVTCSGVALAEEVPKETPSAPTAGSTLDTGKLRVRGSMGGWWDQFRSSSSSRTSRVDTAPGFGLSSQLGFRMGVVFVEYNLVYLPPAFIWPLVYNPSFTGARNWDAAYWSVLGGSIGISLSGGPTTALEPYIGIESGNFVFSKGASGWVWGLTYKTGVILVFNLTGLPILNNPSMGLFFEFRKFIVGGDSAGSLPAGVSENADIFMLGMTFGRF